MPDLAEPSSSDPSQDSKSSKRAAQIELRRTRKRLSTLRTLLLGGGVVYALWAVVMLFFWWGYSTRGFGGSWITKGLGILAVLTSLEAAGLLLGHGICGMRPRLAALIGAVIASLGLTWALLVTDWSQFNGLVMGALAMKLIMTLALWIFVATASRIDRLRGEHPEWFERKSGGVSAAEEANPASNVFAGIFCALGLIVAAALVFQESPEDAATRFEEAWNGQEFETLGAMMDRDSTVMEGFVARVMRRHGEGELPTVEFQEILVEELGQPIAQFHSPQVVLKVRWHQPNPLGPWKILTLSSR